MPELYKNEYYNKDGQWTFYSLESKPIYALMVQDSGQVLHEYDDRECWINLGGTSNADKNLHFVRSEKIESYYYIYTDKDHWLYIDGNFIYRSNKDDIIEKMEWISTQPPLTYEMEETILKIMSQGACRRYEMVDLIYWHLRAIERVRNGNNER